MPERAGDAEGHRFVPDARDDEFCDLCGHPPNDHERQEFSILKPSKAKRRWVRLMKQRLRG